MMIAKLKRGPLTFCCLFLACHALTVSLARADEVSEACDYVSRKLHVFEGGVFRQAPDTFEYDGKIYRRSST
jgi:hypothetical protein